MIILSTQARNAIKRKNKKQEKLLELEREIKELEEKAQIELGKYLMKTWDIEDDHDSEKVFDVIDSLKEDAKSLLKDEEGDTGKSDM